MTYSISTDGNLFLLKKTVSLSLNLGFVACPRIDFLTRGGFYKQPAQGYCAQISYFDSLSQIECSIHIASEARSISKYHKKCSCQPVGMLPRVPEIPPGSHRDSSCRLKRTLDLKVG